MHGAERLEKGIGSESEATKEHVLEMDEVAVAGEVVGKEFCHKGQRCQSRKSKFAVRRSGPRW